jgi:hypothetical protein
MTLLPRLAALAIALLATLVLGAGTAAAAPGVVQDLAGCDTELPANDDDSTDAVPLGFTANVFDAEYTDVFVNNNGNVTFGAPLGEFTPFDFRESGEAMLAPFFADVDTTGTGQVLYGQTTVGGADAFCVVWDDVGYYQSRTDKTNRFQLVLVDRGTDGVDLIFNYDSITWETGEFSGGVNGLGGTSAVAGYSAGDGDSAHALMLPGSFANGGLLDSNAATSLAGHATAGQPAGRFVFQLRQGTPTGGRLVGTVTGSDGDPAVQAPVQLCRVGGACVTRITNAAGRYTASNLTPGTYTVTAFPAPDSNDGSVTATGVTVGGPGTETTRDLTLGEPLSGPPPGTQITSFDETENGVPVAYWGDPLELSTQGCPGGTATYRMILHGRQVRSGSMTEGPAGTYKATIAPLMPDSGDGEIVIQIDCPSTPDEQVDFGIYIDPSGVIRDTKGAPVEGATVTLLRSAAPGGPFFPVPDGSAIMSPSNRVNPDASRSDGRFGWDVVAGYYVVTAEKAGCVSAADASEAAAVSRIMTIPPPVTNLDLRLDCGESGPPGTPPRPAVTQVLSGGGPVAVQRRLIAVRSARLLRGRTLAVKVACARGAIQACAGRVSARIGRRGVGSKRFTKLAPGKSKTVKVKLTRKGRALVRRVKKGKRVRFSIAVSIRDATGAGLTTRRTLRLRR